MKTEVITFYVKKPINGEANFLKFYNKLILNFVAVFARKNEIS